MVQQKALLRSFRCPQRRTKCILTQCVRKPWAHSITAAILNSIFMTPSKRRHVPTLHEPNGPRGRHQIVMYFIYHLLHLNSPVSPAWVPRRSRSAHPSSCKGCRVLRAASSVAGAGRKVCRLLMAAVDWPGQTAAARTSVAGSDRAAARLPMPFRATAARDSGV